MKAEQKFEDSTLQSSLMHSSAKTNKGLRKAKNLNTIDVAVKVIDEDIHRVETGYKIVP